MRYFETDRLIFRALETPADNDFLHAMDMDYVAYSNASIFLHQPPGKASIDKSIEYFQKALCGTVICLKPAPTNAQAVPPVAPQPPTPIGYILLDAQQEKQAHHRYSSIGIGLQAPYQGQGYGTEAIEWMLEWGFQVAGLHRIEIAGFSWNERALNLYRRLGFVEEGRQREKWFYQGGWGDTVELAMLEHEWRERQRLKEKDGAKK